MAYRNKTYVAFASEDIDYYRLMTAWNKNEHIEFDFFNAHDINTARDSSMDETIRRRLRERLANAKQAILLGSADARRKGGDPATFLGYEVQVLLSLKIPIVIANMNGSREVVRANIPQPVLDSDLYTVSVSYQPLIIKYALDTYVPRFASSVKQGPHQYPATTYASLGL